MVAVYAGLLLIGAFCIWRGRGHPERYLYKKVLLLQRGRSRNISARSRMVKTDLKTLYPFSNEQEKTAEYVQKKIRFSFLLFFAGNLLAMLMLLQGNAEKELSEGFLIKRNSYEQGSKLVQVEAQVEGMETSEVWELEIEERKYTETELENLYEQARKQLESEMLGENNSLEEVITNLNLIKKMKGFPFEISWESNNYRLVDAEGRVDNVEMEEAQIVELVACFSYFDFKRDYHLAVQIRPPILSAEEQIKRELKEKVEVEDERCRYEENFYLPNSLGDRAVFWKEKQEDYGALVLLLFGILAIVTYFLQDKELHQIVEKRSHQLLLDYPAIVTELTLYMGAGMTVRGACKKITEQYQKQFQQTGKKRYAYEELGFICVEIENGVSESVALDRFGKRCRINCYMKLGAMLSQNSKKGNGNLLSQLREESERALEERKNVAKKLGEEAGIKLLLPMMLLLAMVLLMILIPALMSF